MNIKKFRIGNVSDFLSDGQMKKVIGGYNGYAECCYCSISYYADKEQKETGQTSQMSGVVCGNYGDTNCSNGISNVYGMFFEVTSVCCNS